MCSQNIISLNKTPPPFNFSLSSPNKKTSEEEEEEKRRGIKMHTFSSVISLFLFFFFFTKTCICEQYKVGDLDSWGIPPSSRPNVYSVWSQAHKFHLGDSLLFLYPPSEDSVIQVREKAYNSCAVSDPIMKMEDGNSVYNLTTPGRFYFISGIAAHCLKNQKLAVDVPTANGTFFPPAEGPAGEGPAGAPSYPFVFGPSAAQSSDSGIVRVSGPVGLLGIVFIAMILI